MDILNKLNTPNDIKDMSIGDLYKLCEDLRWFILSNTSRNGGHLASNLGVVEITVAIHNIFDTSRDRLIFDVGHQCYAHKILTGRKELFDKLRAMNGVSGFPNPEESIHDAFISGHASTSVSVALGMARARTALGEDYSVIALIGDGALTGGLAYEGLSDAGQSGEPLIIILNDNEMSITENVGGLAKHLAHLRVRPYYLSVKKIYRKTIAKIPYAGNALTRFLRRIKSGIKNALRLPSSMFESMGFVYIGPTDGHDIKEVCRLLKVARDMKEPVVIHLKTIKGKGYRYAEEKPDVYHGVPSFNMNNGETKQPESETFADAFGNAISKLAEKDKHIYAITAAMKSGTGLENFAADYPKQFIDVGIAEGHAVTMAGGLAQQGIKPVCAIYSTFLQRAYDMIFHDVCLTNQHVIFAVDRAGMVADDGQTHQGIYDVGYLLQMPNMTVLSPSCVSEIEGMFRYALYEVEGPVAIRYPRGTCNCGCCEVSENESDPPYKPMLLRKGKDTAIVTYGRTVKSVLEAAEILKKHEIDAAVIKITDISSVNINELTSLLYTAYGQQRDAKKLFIVEECAGSGSVASKLALEASADSYSIQIVPFNLGNEIPPSATTDELMIMYGLDGNGVADKVINKLRL